MFKEIKEKLIKEYDSKVDYYNCCYDSAKILYKNTKKNKTEITGALTLAAIIPVFIAMVSLLEGIPGSSISMTLCFASVTAVSYSIGYLGQKLITLNAKRDLRSFTTSYTNRKIVTEFFSYELEKAIAKKKIEIISAILDKVESKEKILEEITKDGKYTITENILSREELNKNYELMLQNYNKKMQELEVMVTQEFLRTKFRNYRKNGVRLSDAISNGFVLGLLLSFPTCMGFLGDQLRNQIPPESVVDCFKQIFSAFIPALVVSPITILSTLGRSNDYLYAFNNLNDFLRENALERTPNKEIEQSLDKNIEKLTNELVELGYSLRETEYTLKQISLQTNDEEKTHNFVNNNEKTWEDVLISEEDVKVYMQESSIPFNSETVFGEDESLKKKTEKKLVRTLKNK